MVTVNPFLPGDMKVETGFCPERLKNIREERGLNKAEAARLFGLSKMGYLRYETAARTPSWQTIVFMAQKLGVSPEYLTGASEVPEPAEYLISRSDDPELFDLIKDMIDTKSPATKGWFRTVTMFLVITGLHHTCDMIKTSLLANTG